MTTQDYAFIWMLVSCLVSILAWWPWVSRRPQRIVGCMANAILSYLVYLECYTPWYIRMDLVLMPVPALVLLIGVLNLLWLGFRRRSSARRALQSEAGVSDPDRRSASNRPPQRR